MSVRKREWVTRKGEKKEAWILDYVDGISLTSTRVDVRNFGTLNVNSRKAQWAYMRDTIAMIT